MTFSGHKNGIRVGGTWMAEPADWRSGLEVGLQFARAETHDSAMVSQRGELRRTRPSITPWKLATSSGSNGIQRSSSDSVPFTT